MTPDSPWKTIIPGLVGASAGYLIDPAQFKSWSFHATAMAFIAFVAIVVLAQIIVEVLVILRANSVFRLAATSVTSTWQAKSGDHFLTVSVQLLSAAYGVTERYYPGSSTMPPRESLLLAAKGQLKLLFND